MATTRQMVRQLRSDERFVAEALARHFSGTWTVGEDPPDAYLTIGPDKFPLEVSTLTQHVMNERGGTHARFSEDASALRLADELDEELRTLIPDGRMIVLTLRAPVLKWRKTKEELKRRILWLAANVTSETADLVENICGNAIDINLSSFSDADGRKVLAAVVNLKSSPKILLNVRTILEERIADKTLKCCSLAFKGPLWLGLLNDYWLAGGATYRQALAQMTDSHCFEKIFLVSPDGSVAELYARH